jgi:3-phosphoshikimate 1-carboxyvinyltransferase
VRGPLPGWGSRRVVEPGGPFLYDGPVPGDKSISHRAALLSLLAPGTSHILHYAPGEDASTTLEAVQALGGRVSRESDGSVRVEGTGGRVREPEDVVDARNSGTLARLLLGILGGSATYAVVTGDASLRQRPMRRVLEPLGQLGGRFAGRLGGDRLPVVVLPNPVRAGEVRLAVASAQVKTAVLLWGLFASGETAVVEPALSRDHTERMLAAAGVRVEQRSLGVGHRVAVWGPALPQPRTWRVPGDPSSAAFVFGLAVVTGGKATVRHMGVNPLRSAYLDVLQEMGAHVEVEEPQVWDGEPVAHVTVSAPQPLRAVRVAGARIPSLIDELPLLAALAAVAHGRTEIRDAQELRVKETDRIAAMVEGLSRMGVVCGPYEDGLWVQGPARLRPAQVEAHGDHRVAMALAVLAQRSPGPVEILGAQAADVSFPGFWQLLPAPTR